LHENSNRRNAVLIVGADEFERALHAIEQAGFQVNEDFSVLELGPDFAWLSRAQSCGIARASMVRPKSRDVTEGPLEANKGRNISKSHAEFVKGRQ
jgi:hypothetical protein